MCTLNELGCRANHLKALRFIAWTAPWKVIPANYVAAQMLGFEDYEDYVLYYKAKTSNQFEKCIKDMSPKRAVRWAKTQAEVHAAADNAEIKELVAKGNAFINEKYKDARIDIYDIPCMDELTVNNLRALENFYPNDDVLNLRGALSPANLQRLATDDGYTTQQFAQRSKAHMDLVTQLKAEEVARKAMQDDFDKHVASFEERQAWHKAQWAKGISTSALEGPGAVKLPQVNNRN